MKVSCRCPGCGRVEELELGLPAACRCGEPMMISYDLEESSADVLKARFRSRPRGVWRYIELLPDLGDGPVTMGEGGTPLYQSSGLGRSLGLRKLYIKNESTNPTGAFTDRGATVEVTGAVRLGVPRIFCVAPGNLSVSISAYSARAGIPCTVYFRAGVEHLKVLQALAYDAEVLFTNDLGAVVKSLRLEQPKGHLVTSANPLLIEGLKTCTLEILEDLDWSPPDWILIPIGSGAHVTASWKAVKEAEEVGLLEGGLPRILGGQISTCAPVAEAYMRGADEVAPPFSRGLRVEFPDIAEPNPVWGSAALRVLRESRGQVLTVSHEQLLDAVRVLAKSEGILAEPAAAVSLAALIDAVNIGIVKRDETVVYIVTGSGMKDPLTIQTAVRDEVPPTHTTRGRIGETKRRILEILCERPLHGYGIQRELASRYGVRVRLPTVYEHLSQLYAMGMVRHQLPGRLRGASPRKVYYLTEYGREVLESLAGPKRLDEGRPRRSSR